MPVIGSMTNRSSRRAREMSAANSIGRPPAASRESDGRTTMPSGTPITPIGIWSSVNATLNAVTRRSPSVEASEVTTTNVIWLGAEPERPRRHQHRAPAAPAGSSGRS